MKSGNLSLRYVVRQEPQPYHRQEQGSQGRIYNYKDEAHDKVRSYGILTWPFSTTTVGFISLMVFDVGLGSVLVRWLARVRLQNLHR